MLNKIYNENCLDILSSLDDNTINLVVTSPPYNVDLGNNKYNKDGYDEYDDSNSYEEYLGFLEKVFTSIYYKLPDDGRVCINIGDQKNGQIKTSVYLTQIMESIGYNNYATIIWNKNQTSNRCAWGSYLSPSCPSFPTTFEYILVFYVNDIKLQRKGESDLTKEEFVRWTNPIWSMKPQTTKIGHPAPFPLELPYRLIKMLSYKKDVVFDPFIGSGTTAIAAVQTGRNYIGCEISKEYCEIAEKRISDCYNK